MKKLLLGLLSITFFCAVSYGQVTCPPAVTHFDFNFTKPVATDQKVGGASVCDQDVGQTHVWSIVETGTPWKIVNGDIVVADATAINNSTAASYNITIKVIDNGVPPLFSTATVTLNNTNTPPVINPQTFTLAENLANGALVGTIIASDVNPTQAKTFTIISGNTNGAFSINASTGALYVSNTTVLNYEIMPTFALVVKVADNGNPVMTAQATITINLTDVNEPPIVVDQTFE